MKALAIGALAVLLVGLQPARAQREGPWCAYVVIGEDSMAERCDMRSFEMCLEEIRGQGASHCGNNPRYRAAAEPRRKNKKQRLQ